MPTPKPTPKRTPRTRATPAADTPAVAPEAPAMAPEAAAPAPTLADGPPRRGSRASRAPGAGGGRRGPLDGRLAVDALLVAPDRRRRDVANYGKILCDALTGVAWIDDVQLDDVRWRRGAPDADAARVEVTISAAEVA